MSTTKYLIVLGGPTASGKTGFAIELAKHFNTEIMSCDSRQFYTEMTIGTAKPSVKELAAAQHHFINSLSIHENYTAGDFERDGLLLLAELFKTRDVVIMTGGSGLFINALCFGLDEFPKTPADIRVAVEKDYQEKGLLFLQKELQGTDYEYFTKVDTQNIHRVMRAIEVIRSTGKTFTSFRKGNQKKRPFSPIFLQMHQSRQVLYDRINLRVDLMIKNGLLAEVEALLPYKNLNALQTVGYSEIMSYLSGEYTIERAIELIKQNSRRYAKRQITWMRRDGFWKHIRPENWKIALSFIELSMQQKIGIQKIPAEEINQYAATLSSNKNVQYTGIYDAGNLAAYLAIEIKGRKKEFHPPTFFTKNKLIMDLFAHEIALLAEEMQG